MNPSTLIGILSGIALLASVRLFSAEDSWLFFDLPSIGIVLFGTMAATFISYPLKEVLRIFSLIGTVLRNERLYAQKDIEELVDISRLWMSGNLPAVENSWRTWPTPFSEPACNWSST